MSLVLKGLLSLMLVAIIMVIAGGFYFGERTAIRGFILLIFTILCILVLGVFVVWTL